MTAAADPPGERTVRVSGLQMLSPDQLAPDGPPGLNVQLVRCDPPGAALSRRCYEQVGAPWHWVDRLGWSEQDWQDWVDRRGHELWTCWADLSPTVDAVSDRTDDGLAGYFELDVEPAGAVQVSYLGLLPGYTGQGLGGWLLTQALHRAWQLPGTRRVWLQTCDLDAPAALPNYLARGLRVFDSWTERRRLRI